MNMFSTMADDHLAWYRHSLAAGELPAPSDVVRLLNGATYTATGTIIALIAEVERLRKKCDDLTVDGFQAKLKQLDEAKKEIERLQAEVKRLKEVVAGYCGSGQRIQDLSDDCGLLEESNKTLRVEVERLRGDREQIRVALRGAALWRERWWHWHGPSNDKPVSEASDVFAEIERILSAKDAGAAEGGG